MGALRQFFSKLSGVLLFRRGYVLDAPTRALRDRRLASGPERRLQHEMPSTQAPDMMPVMLAAEAADSWHTLHAAHAAPHAASWDFGGVPPPDNCIAVQADVSSATVPPMQCDVPASLP